jgi:hypothetical protein
MSLLDRAARCRRIAARWSAVLVVPVAAKAALDYRCGE